MKRVLALWRRSLWVQMGVDSVGRGPRSSRASSSRSGPWKHASVTPGLALLALHALPGCGVQQAEPAPDIPPTAVSVPFESVAQRQTSGIDRQTFILVRTPAEWADLWSRAAAPVVPQEDPPAIDFSRRMVAIAALGRRATGGFSVRIGAVYEDRDRLYVVYTETSPGEGCLTTQAFTAPVSAVSIPRSGKPLSFVRRTEELACD